MRDDHAYTPLGCWTVAILGGLGVAMLAALPMLAFLARSRP